MTALIHVLGSDIPHHNQTVLRFFNDELAADPQAGDLWSSVMRPACVMGIRRWTSPAIREEVAGAGGDCASQSQPSAALFFHGQFNTGLWLALLSGGIRPSQFNWHIWGRICMKTRPA